MKWVMIVCLAGWSLLYPAFSYGQSIHWNRPEFHSVPAAHNNKHSSLTYALNSRFNGNAKTRIFDPESEWSNTLSAGLYSRLNSKLEFIFRISYQQIERRGVQNILETDPYKPDFIFLTDTTKGHFSIQKPSISFDFLYHPTSKISMQQEILYHFGRSVKDQYTAPINSFLSFSYRTGTTYRFNTDHSATMDVLYRYGKEVISLSDIEELPPIYTRRYRGFFKFRDLSGSFSHYEKSHLLSLSFHLENKGDRWQHKAGFSVSRQKQTNFDRYLSDNHPDFDSRFNQFFLFDSLAFRINQKWETGLSLNYSWAQTRLINNQAQTLAIRETRQIIGLNARSIIYFARDHFIQNVHASFSVLFISPEYEDFLADYLYSKTGKGWRITFGGTLGRRSGSVEWIPEFELYKLSGLNFRYLYPVPFSGIGLTNKVRFHISGEKLLELGLHLTLIRKDQFQKNAPAAFFSINYILPG